MYHAGNSSQVGTPSPQNNNNNINGGAESSNAQQHNSNNISSGTATPSPGPSSSNLRRGGGGGGGSSAAPPRLHGSPAAATSAAPAAQQQQQQQGGNTFGGGPSGGSPPIHHHHLHHHHHHHHHQMQHQQQPPPPPQQQSGSGTNNNHFSNRSAPLGGGSPYPQQPPNISNSQQQQQSSRGMQQQQHSSGSYSNYDPNVGSSSGGQQQQQLQQPSYAAPPSGGAPPPVRQPTLQHHHHHHHMLQHHHVSSSVSPNSTPMYGGPGPAMTSPQPQSVQRSPYPPPSNASRSGSNTPHLEGSGYGGNPYLNNSGTAGGGNHNMYGGAPSGSAGFPPSPHVGQLQHQGQGQHSSNLAGSGTFQTNNWNGGGGVSFEPSVSLGPRQQSNNGAGPSYSNYNNNAAQSQQAYAAGGAAATNHHQQRSGNFAPGNISGHQQQQPPSGMSSMNRSPNPQQQGQQHHNNNGQHQNSQQRGSNDPHHHTNNNSAADALSYGGGGGGGPSSPSYVHSNQSNNSTSQQQGSRSWSGVSTPHHHQHHVSSVAAPEFSQQHRNAPPPPPTTDFSGSYNSNSNNGGRDGGSSGSSSFHLQQQQQQQAMHHQHHHLHHHHHHQQQNTHSPDPYHGDYSVNHNNNSNSGNNSAPPPPIRLPMNTAATDNSNINKQREYFDGQQQRASGYNPQYRQQQHQGQMPNGGTPISPLAQGVQPYPGTPLQRQYSNNNNNSEQQLGGGVVPPQFSRSGNNNAAPNGNSMRSQQQGNPQQRGGPPTGSSGSNNSMFPPTVSVGNNHHGAAPHSLSNSNNSGAPPPPPQMGLSHHHHHHHHHQFHHHHMHHSNNNNHVVNQHMDPSSSSSSQQHNNNVVGGNNGVPLPPSAGWAPPSGGAPMPPPHFHQQHHHHQHHQDFNDGVAPAFGHGGGAASVSVGGSYMPQYPQQQHQERQQQQQRGGGSGSAGNNNNNVPMYSPEMPLQHQHQHQQNLQPHHHNHQFHAQLQQHQQQRGAGVSGQQFPSSSQPQQQRSNQRGNNNNNNNHNNSGDYSNQINRLHQQHQLPPPPAQLGYQHHHHQMHQHHHQFPLNPNTNHHLHNSGRQQLQDGVDQGYFPADGVDQTAAAHGEFAGDNGNNGRGMLSISPEAASSDDSQSSQCVDLYVFLRNKGLLERYILGDLLPEDDAESKGKSPSAAAAAAHTSSSATDEHVGSSGGGGGHRIAVDANYALLRLRDKMRQLDPLWFLHAPLPKLLLDLIKTDVENLRDVGLEPIYVFNGLGASGDVEAFVTPSRTMMQRSQQWKTLDPTFMPDDEAPQLSRDDCIPLNDVFDVSFSEDVEMAVGRYLRSELGVTVITAPFLNWAQMILMHKEGQVKLLFAPPEALMFAYDDTELIMDIETANPMAPVAVVRRKTVLERLFPRFVMSSNYTAPPPPMASSGYSEDSLDASNHHHHQQHAPPVVAKDYSKAGDRFLDFCLLTSTHPAIQSLRASIQLSVEDLYEELSSATPKYRTIQELIEANQPLRSATDNKSEWQKHAKGRCFMRHCIVMSLSPLTDTPLQYLSKSLRNHNHSLLQDAALAGGSGRATIPSNIGGVFGNMVPDGLFFLQLTGLLSVGTMTCITQTYVCDEGPVCDSTDFRDAMHVLISLRTQVTYQLVREIAEPKTVRAATAAISALGENESAAHHHHQQQQAGGQQHPVPYLDRFKSISWVRWYRPILQSVPRPVEIIKLDDWKLPSEIRAAGASNVAGSGPLTTTTTSSANSSPVGRKGNHNNNSFASSSSAAPPAAVAAAPSASVVVNGIVRLDSVIPLKKVLSLNQLATPAVPRGSVTSSESLYTTVQEVYCAVILKSLDLLGYFTHAVQTTVGGQPQHLQLDDSSHSGSAAGGGNNNNDDNASNNTSSSQVQSDLSPFSREVSYVVDCDPEHQYQYVLLTELVRTQSLSARPIVFADETDAAAGDANVSPSLGAAAAASASTNSSTSPSSARPFDPVSELLCRIACALPLSVDTAYPMFDDIAADDAAATGDGDDQQQAVNFENAATASASNEEKKTLLPLYDKNITAFLQLVRVTNHALRELVEVMTASLYLDGTAGCGLSDLAGLEQQLPFQHLPNPLAALILRYVFRRADDFHNDSTPSERRKRLAAQFPMFDNIEKVIREVLRFIIHGLHLLSVFYAADQELVDHEIRRNVPAAVAKAVSLWRLFLGNIDNDLPVCHLNMELTDAPM